MLEAIRIRKAGYAIRITQEEFAKRYRAILGPKKKLQVSNKQICEMIFKEVLTYKEFKKVLDPVLKKWQIGLTKVFMKEDVRTSLERAIGFAV
jgi:myosin heavy subunit